VSLQHRWRRPKRSYRPRLLCPVLQWLASYFYSCVVAGKQGWTVTLESSQVIGTQWRILDFHNGWWSGDGSPPVGSSSRAPVGGLEDEAPQKLMPFGKLMHTFWCSRKRKRWHDAVFYICILC